MPPPGSGDVTVVSSESSDDSAAGEFTLAGWSPQTGVHFPGRDGPRRPLGRIYFAVGGIMGIGAAWLVAVNWAEPTRWAPVLVLGLFALVVQYFPVVVSHANISLGVGFFIAACLMAGPAVGAVVVATVMLLWSVSRETLPWYSKTRGKTVGVRFFRPLYASASGCLVYGVASHLSFTVFSLEAPVASVTLETMGASVLLTMSVYLFSNLASLLVNALAGENIRLHLRTVIPTPALAEFLALPAALLLVVTEVKLGAAAFALLIWLYLMAAFLGWRSWMDRRQIDRRLKDVELLHRVGASLLETLEMGDLVIRFHHAIREIVRFDKMIIILSDTTEGVSQTFAFDGFGARGDVTTEQLDDTESRPEGLFFEGVGAVYTRDFGAGEAATLRLRLDFDTEKVPSEQKLMLLETMCQQGGTALSNGYLFRLANTDPLTQVASRRYFERSLRSVALREEIFAIIMMDLDHFKRVNDQFGHQSGDAVLRDLAEVLRGTLRVMDIAGRYGGEEFVVLLPGAASPEATAVAERVRRTLEQRTVITGDHRITYTSSFGVADSGEGGAALNPMDVVWKADEALLTAKRVGRNQVITYSSLAR